MTEHAVPGAKSASKGARKRRKDGAQGFGRYVPWMPSEFPADAIAHWPGMNDWPTSAQIEHFVESTKALPDARLAVLSGLRRWAEPASSQLMVSLASVIVSIIGIAIAIAAILTANDRTAFLVVVILGALYLLLALAGFALALRM